MLWAPQAASAAILRGPAVYPCRRSLFLVVRSFAARGLRRMPEQCRRCSEARKPQERGAVRIGEVLAGVTVRVRRERHPQRRSWLHLHRLPSTAESFVERDQADDQRSLALHALVLRHVERPLIIEHGQEIDETSEVELAG